MFSSQNIDDDDTNVYSAQTEAGQTPPRNYDPNRSYNTREEKVSLPIYQEGEGATLNLASHHAQQTEGKSYLGTHFSTVMSSKPRLHRRLDFVTKLKICR